MKTQKHILPLANCQSPAQRPCARLRFSAIGNRQSAIGNFAGFTLIELLVVIAIMAVLASFTLVVVTQIKKVEYVNVATAEMSQIEKSLEDYHGKYNTYPPSNNSLSPLDNTLYYELSGVTNDLRAKAYITLDGACTIPTASYPTAFTAGSPPSSIDGIINCTKGTVEEGTAAVNFLPSLKANRIGTVQSGGVWISNLVTSVRGPDIGYMPYGPGYADNNPFRYQYPGTNNPTSYDLYVQLQYRGTKYLVCNWSKTAIKNSPLP